MANATLPEKMNGILVSETGGVEVLQYLEDLPVPTPQAGEILVKNDLIGVNYTDTYYRTGLYTSPKPEILGREAVGTIVSTGPAPLPPNLHLAVGDTVAWLATGGYAAYTAVPAAKAVRVPASVSAQDAVAGLVQGLTALTLVRESYPAKRGDWILVHAAAGGVGLLLCQVLRGIGARVIGTASTAEKGALARENGAEFVIDYSHEDVVERVKEITGGEGVIAVYDGVGKATFDADLEMLARKGSLISYGNASGPVAPLTISRLSQKNIRVMRPTLFQYIYTREEFEHYTNELFEIIGKKQLNLRVHEIYPLKDVARAHTDLEGRKTTGKLLLKP